MTVFRLTMELSPKETATRAISQFDQEKGRTHPKITITEGEDSILIDAEGRLNSLLALSSQIGAMQDLTVLAIHITPPDDTAN